MNASVLILGDSPFFQRLTQQVQSLSALTVNAALTLGEAEALFVEAARKEEVPSVVLIQTSHPSSWPLCQYIQQHHPLNWIYCILLDDQESFSSAIANTDLDTYTSQQAIQALDRGANAYLWLPIDAKVVQYQLLDTQIKVGLRQINSYRELQRTNDLLSTIALTDPLTQLGNRRAFDWELPRQIQACRTQGVPLSLMILDIDRFKDINDTHGHLIGDKVLILLAERLQGNMRFYETPFRYGGEEFVVVMSNTNQQEAVMVGERLRQLVSEQAFVVNAALPLALTISIGIAYLMNEDDAKGISLLDRADQNLLRAKVSGRNRVVA